MRNLHKISVASAVVALVGISSPVMAQDATIVSGTVDSRLILTSGCAVDAGDGSIDNEENSQTADFGTMDFGSHPGTFTGDLTAQAAGTGGATQVTCTSGVTTLKIKVGPGNHGSAQNPVGVGTRAMKNSASNDYVAYEVYSKPDHTDPYQTAAIDFTPTADTPFDLPLYGKVTKSSSAAWPSGQYTDILTVELDW